MRPKTDRGPEDEEVRLLVEQLDAKIDKTDAGVVIGPGGAWPGESLVGNKRGLLRLGVELLKAGLDLPPTPTRTLVKELVYLCVQPEASVSSVARNDELRHPERLQASGGWKGLLMILMATLSWVLYLFVFVIGLTTVGQWLIRWYYGV